MKKILMTKEMLNQRIEMLKIELDYHQSIETNCSRCEHHDNGSCLMWDSKIPADVQLIGCDDWELDPIPF